MLTKNAMLTWLLVPALLCMFVAQRASAAEVHGKLSTVIETYEDYVSDKTAVPVYQYGMFNVSNITDQGLSFKMYGRLADDLNNQDDKMSELYYAYLEQNNILNKVDVRLGRQFIDSVAGVSIMDGLRVKYSPMKQLRVTAFAGADIHLDDDSDTDDSVGGIEVSGDISDLSYSLGYLVKLDDKYLSKEIIGGSLSYLYEDYLRMYTDVQYNNLNELVSYMLAGFSYQRDSWELTSEYLYSLPVFDATSIYSVFAAEEYQEIYNKLNYRLGDGYNVYGIYTLEMYDEYPDANVYEVGFEKVRSDRLSGYFDLVMRDDKGGQDKTGVKAYVSYLFNKYAVVGIGANYDVYQRSEDDDDDTTSKRFWIDTTSYLSDRLNMQIKLESAESDFYDYYTTARVRLNYTF